MPALNSTDPLPLLAPIGQPVGDNEGGVQEIHLLPQAALLRAPIRAGSSIVGDLALVPGAVWYPLRATLDTAGFDQAFAEDRQQGLYEGKLVGFVAEDTPELAEALLRYRNVRLLVLYRDRNDRLKLAGDATSWYTLSYTLATQTGAANRAGYALEFAGRTLKPALFYQGQYTLASGGATGTGALPVSTGSVQVFDGQGTLLKVVPAGKRLIITGPFRVDLEVQ
jgi:hypothetical protein